MRITTIFLALVLGMMVSACGGEQPPAKPAKPAVAEPKSALVDINRASAAELAALKGIGEARAKAIIRGRPYARKDELVQRQIIPQPVYDRIKDQIVAKQK